jgi:glutamate decarboxylase
MPEQSIPKEAAYQIINDELMLDGNPRLNLASFVTTWMEPECDKLIQASVNKNYVDMDEYPVTTELQVRSPRRSCFILAPSIAHQSSRSYLGPVSVHESVVRRLVSNAQIRSISILFPTFPFAC